MILRMWKARSTVEGMDKYVQHATTKVFPALSGIEGYRGAYLLRREFYGGIEFVVLTLWDSMTAVGKFTGAEPEKAVVDPEVQAFLTAFDRTVSHFEVVHSVTQKE